MGVVITRDDIQAYAEVDYIINHMNVKYKDKVPEKLKLFFSEFKDPTHVIKIDPYVSLAKQGLKRYTLEIIALIHLKYWCQDEERKKELYSKMMDNQIKLNEQIKERFSTDNLFDGKDHSEEVEGFLSGDYSRPKPVQRYSEFTENNSDIQDYTDCVEDTNNVGSNNQKLNTSDKPVDEDQALIDNAETLTQYVSAIFRKITNKLHNLFKKA